MKLLLKKAADVDPEDSKDRMPLPYASANGHEAEVVLLLEKAIDMKLQGWI